MGVQDKARAGGRLSPQIITQICREYSEITPESASGPWEAAASFKVLTKAETAPSCCPGSRRPGSPLLPPEPASWGTPLGTSLRKWGRTAPRPAPRGQSPWTSPPHTRMPCLGAMESTVPAPPASWWLTGVRTSWKAGAGASRESGLYSTGAKPEGSTHEVTVSRVAQTHRQWHRPPLPCPAWHCTLHCWERPLSATSLPSQGQMALTAKPLRGLNAGRT